ncbi:thiamine phosphate synthase [Hirschia baltica]|uniref:Thiamine-phosphate synthase n=1 Tax=Hirschia baltica (strain ATCC 49814 / DSM 5838 / IFAM 1418) TaxID=582402 RepID=C6XRN5_HIRBI|nr:thiamine phosphate synthase [Hirschia baltica]ACT60645.1 thiamine-phosphate pyrophosphorylase [Hirschia baltica ATCC 49814]
MMNQECRLYLITPPVIEDVEAFARDCEQALDGGDVACLQIRLKTREGVAASDAHIEAVAKRILPMAQAKDVAVLINDRPDLAKKFGADGVHIGQDDVTLKDARQIVGDDAIVGVTCHDSRHLGMEAGEAGADYVAFGAFYPTQTKDPKAKAELETLTWWQQFIEVPCVAIGGITVENAKPLIDAGADFLAVSSGVWNYADGPKAAVEAFNVLMQSKG